MVSVIVIARRCDAAFERKEETRLDDVQDPSRGVSPAPLCNESLEATRDTLSELSLALCLPTTKFVREIPSSSGDLSEDGAVILAWGDTPSWSNCVVRSSN